MEPSGNRPCPAFFMPPTSKVLTPERWLDKELEKARHEFYLYRMSIERQTTPRVVLDELFSQLFKHIQLWQFTGSITLSPPASLERPSEVDVLGRPLAVHVSMSTDMGDLVESPDWLGRKKHPESVFVFKYNSFARRHINFVSAAKELFKDFMPPIILREPPSDKGEVIHVFLDGDSRFREHLIARSWKPFDLNGISRLDNSIPAEIYYYFEYRETLASLALYLQRYLFGEFKFMQGHMRAIGQPGDVLVTVHGRGFFSGLRINDAIADVVNDHLGGRRRTRRQKRRSIRKTKTKTRSRSKSRRRR